jgi:hypothetical protein
MVNTKFCKNTIRCLINLLSKKPLFRENTEAMFLHLSKFDWNPER